jgi:hypothetical protein
VITLSNRTLRTRLLQIAGGLHELDVAEVEVEADDDAADIWKKKVR